jgi:hypothetical protein
MAVRNGFQEGEASVVEECPILREEQRQARCSEEAGPTWSAMFTAVCISVCRLL